MIKAFVKPFFRQARTYKWFSTQSAFISQLRTINDDFYEVEARVATLKDVLSQTESESPNNIPEIRQAIFKLISEGPETYETIRDDNELVERLLEFQKVFLKESDNQGLGVAFILTSFMHDVKLQKINRNIILKKVADALSNPNVTTLNPLAHLFEDFHLIAQECNRSDISDLLLERINELLVHHRNNLSLQGKMGLLRTMLIAKEKVEEYKLSAMFHTLMNDLEGATFDEYIEIMHILKEAFPDKLDAYRDELEKKLNSFLESSNPPRGFAKVFDFIATIASEKTWDNALKAVNNNIDSISNNDKCLVLYSMAVNARINEQLVQLLYKHTGKHFHDLSLSSLMKIYFANKYFNIETDYVDFEKLQQVVFELPFIQSLKVDDLFVFLENVLLFESIPDDKRDLALTEIERQAMYYGSSIYEAYKTIMANHFEKDSRNSNLN